MVAILCIAYRTDCKYYLHIVVALSQQFYGTAQIVFAGNYAEFLLAEQSLRTLVAVVHNLARRLLDVDVVSAQSDENGVESLCSPFYRVQYRSRVVHYTERIYKGSEFPINEFRTDIACET